MLAAAAWLRETWLRDPSVPYLVAVAVATTAAGLLAAVPRADGGRRRRLVTVAAAVLFVGVAVPPQLQLWRLEHRWSQVEEEARVAAGLALDALLRHAAGEARATAVAALQAPARPAPAFAALAPLVQGREERAVVLDERGVPLAWAGMLRVDPDSLVAELGIVRTPFYDVLYASARTEAGDRRAVSTVLLQSHPPADAIARDLRAVEAIGDLESGFQLTVSAPGAAPAAQAALQLSDGSWLEGQVAPLVREQVVARTTERALTRGLAALALLLVCFLATEWGRDAGLRRRLLALLIALLAVGAMPLNALSNVSPLFDPTYYFAPRGVPLTASVGALALTSGLLLLALLAVLRSTARVQSRRLALLLVLLAAGLGPFLLRDLARGISSAGGQATVPLWLAWQLALFLAATTVLLVGASAGRAVLGRWRGLPAAVAPLAAGVAALLAQPLWEAPGGWPWWYAGLWIVAAAALAFTRRTRAIITTAAMVAGLGAMTLVWSSTTRQRVQLAERDVQELTTVDQVLQPLLERFAGRLATAPAPTTRAELLARYAASDVPAADYAVQLAAWSPAGDRVAEVTDLAAESATRDELAEAVADARRTGEPQLGPVSTPAGTRVLLAVPFDDGWVTTVAVAARTRLFPDDPYMPLVRGTPATGVEPPYTLVLLEEPGSQAGDPAALTERPRWTRRGDLLHGDWLAPVEDRRLAVHVEVELRSLGALVPRGTLVLLLDLLVVAALWLLNALSLRGSARWLRAQRTGWRRSYRARLTLALFGFFLVPALAFGLWSARQLQQDVRQTRELLVGETLRTAVRDGGDADSANAAAAVTAAVATGRAVGDAPLLLYADGALRAASDDLVEALAPLGRLLPPDVALDIGSGGGHLQTSREQQVGAATLLVGYRALGGRDARTVLVAPGRADEIALARRRRDLGVLVLFAVALGGLAALWLSGVAARQLARPIGALRRAALRIAAGELEPPLGDTTPPAEFVPVFSAFRRMAADLAASRQALEEAERRTAAVLRDAASAVIAVDAAGGVTLANPAAERLFGAALQPGAPLARLGAPALEGALQRVAAGAPAEEPLELELGRRQLQVRVTPLQHGGGAVLTLDDVTEVARAQRVLAWGEMARQVAHEIKNPLTPIRLGVQHLRRSYTSGRGDYERVLSQNVERILAEIDRLDEIARAFSRYGMAPEERRAGEPVDVAAIARDVVELERLGEAGGQVTWRLHGADEPCVALARDDELREVLLNILENARLASAAEVQVRVLRDGSDPGEPDAGTGGGGPGAGNGAGRVRLVVSDDGHGIPGDTLSRVFEPHFSTRTSGSGLGLAISRRLVEGWGGSIAIRSTAGAGTDVEITLAAATP